MQKKKAPAFLCKCFDMCQSILMFRSTSVPGNLSYNPQKL